MQEEGHSGAQARSSALFYAGSTVVWYNAQLLFCWLFLDVEVSPPKNRATPSYHMSSSIRWDVPSQKPSSPWGSPRFSNPPHQRRPGCPGCPGPPGIDHGIDQVGDLLQCRAWHFVLRRGKSPTRGKSEENMGRFPKNGSTWRLEAGKIIELNGWFSSRPRWSFPQTIRFVYSVPAWVGDFSDPEKFNYN